jgi:hypothetical protein
MADPRPLSKTVPGSIAERVRLVVSRMTGRAPVLDRMDLAADLNLDEADMAELVAAVELACRMDFLPAETDGARLVGDLVAAAEKKQAAADNALREAIEDLAAGALAWGQPVDLAAAARVLATQHRSTSLDLAAIEAAIGRAIASRGSPGDSSPKA